jgi:hypothetical protein
MAKNNFLHPNGKRLEKEDSRRRGIFGVTSKERYAMTLANKRNGVETVSEDNQVDTLNVYLKNFLMLTSVIKSAALGLVIFAFTGCKKDTETVNNPVYNLRGNANGTQEAPTRVTTPATGTLTGTYNKDNNTMSYTITWTGLTGGNPSAMHFHGAADPGVAAGVQVPITGFTPATSGTVTSTAVLNDTQEADLLNGLWYYNIHNATYPAGEIRGQVVLTQ